MAKRAQVDHYSGPFTLGIDVSKWQGPVTWPAVAKDKQQIKFAIIRTGDGISDDQRFVENWVGAKSAGLIRGAYRYFRADRNGKTQALKDVALLDKGDGFIPGVDLPPALDLEDGSLSNLPRGVYTDTTGADLPLDLVATEALEYLESIESELGVLPIIYTGQTFHWKFSQGRPDLAVHFAKYPLWTPSYSVTCRMPVDRQGNGFPWTKYTFWQYTSKGLVTGVNGAVDINKFRGDLPALVEFVESTKKAGVPKSTMDYTEATPTSACSPTGAKGNPNNAIRDKLQQIVDLVADINDLLKISDNR